MDRSTGLTLTAIPGIPLVTRGSDIVGLILAALSSQGMSLCSGDVLVITQKIVSKSEGRMINLCDVEPGERAVELALLAAAGGRVGRGDCA